MRGENVMKKKFAVIALALVCAGCALYYHPTEEAYNRMVSSWVGRGTADLYAEWGYPHQSKNISDNTVLECYYNTTEHTTYYPKVAEKDFYRPFVYDWDAKINKFHLAPAPEEYNCKTSFVIVNGIVVDYSYKGFGCVY